MVIVGLTALAVHILTVLILFQVISFKTSLCDVCHQSLLLEMFYMDFLINIKP